jgi:nucleoside 2-deoxyribosyltransferase
MPTVYLAGKMTGLTQKEMSGWRNSSIKFLKGREFKVLNPVATNLGEAPTARQIVDSNKYQIRHSDIVLAELDYEAVSLGTIGEIMFAYCIGKPVIVWGQATRVITHPWVHEHVVVVYKTLEEALTYIVQNYRR